MSLGQRRGVIAGLVLTACGVVACHPKPPLLSLFTREVNLYVAVSDRVAKTDTGNISAMVETLEADLEDAGRIVNIVPARLDEKPPFPRLELQVMSSDSGDAQMRGAGHLSQLLSPITGVALIGAGTGSMLVDVYIVSGDGRHPRYLGRYSGSSFGTITDASIEAGKDVAHQISDSLTRSPD
jgi:hypothetical protein